MKSLIVEKLVSRKLVVFLVATGLMVGGILPLQTWTTIALGYLGAQGVVDAVDKFSKKSK